MTSVFPVWIAANMAALGVWLAARKRHALKARLLRSPILSPLQSLSLMGRLAFVFALSMTALSVCWVGVLCVRAASYILFEAEDALRIVSLGALAGIVVGCIFHRVAQKCPEFRDVCKILMALGYIIFHIILVFALFNYVN